MAAGDPIGLDLCSVTVDADTLPTSGGAWAQFTFDTSHLLIDDKKYAIVVGTNLNEIGDKLEWGQDITAGYVGGLKIISNDSGSTWTQAPTRDCAFKTISAAGEEQTFETVNALQAIYVPFYAAQTFICGNSDYIIISVELRLRKTTESPPGTVTVSIRKVEGESYPSPSVESIYVGSAGNFMVAATNSGISISTDFGDNWTLKNPDGLGTTDWVKGICSSDGTYLVVVSDAADNAIYRSADSGASWASIAGSDTYSVSDLACSDDGQYWVLVGTNSTDPTESCYISTDYGINWIPYKPVAASIAWTECDISNDGSVIAVSTTDYFYISIDSGTSWLEQGMASSAEAWKGLSLSGDGTIGLVANTSASNEYFVGTKTNIYSRATWAESTFTSFARTLIDDVNAATANTTLGLGTGDAVTHDTLTLSSIAAEGSDVDKFLVDSTGIIKYRTGAEVLSDIGAAAASHLHNAQTLQLDGVNSDGGAFAFNTTGAVTFNQSLITPGETVTGASVLGLNSAVFQPAAGGDSTMFFRVNDEDGNNIITIDTVNNAWLPATTRLGTVEGSYNFINGTAFASKSGYTHCVAVGSSLANSATGTVTYNNLVGSSLASSATGNVFRNNLVGSSLANSATGDVTYNNLVGSSLASSATGNVFRNNLTGQSLANSFTGTINNSFISGYRCVYNTTNEVNCEKVIAFSYEALRGSSAADLDNSIAIGYQAGLNNAYNNPALFGTQAVADAHKQIVLGSAYYTGGVRLYGADLGFTSATSYFTGYTPTHSDADGGGAFRLIGKREDGAGTPSEAGQIEISHDGSGVNNQLGKIVVSVNTEAGLVEALRIDSDLRVGIGTIPETDFHIKNLGGEAQLLLQSLAASDATIRIRNGSSSKWTFGNDASNDEFIISTGSILGTPKLTILQSGYAGFGTGATAPNAPLEVKGAKPGEVGGHQGGQLQVTGSVTDEFYSAVITGHNAFNGNTQLWYLGSTSASSHNDIGFINRQNAAMHFSTNNTTRMTIDATGNVTLAVIAAEGSDVDKFLVDSSGVIKYRTGAQLLSDIGLAGALLGDSTAGRVIRQSVLRIADGTNVNTIKCTFVSVWNGDQISQVDNISKGATTGDFSLDATGKILIVENSGLSGTVLAVLASIQIINSSGSLVDSPMGDVINGDIRFRAATGAGGGTLDFTSILTGAGLFYVAFTYITDA